MFSNRFIGIDVPHVGKFRVDIRRSVVQKYDTVISKPGFPHWSQIPSSDVTQSVDRLKGVSQITFKDGVYVFEIEMSQHNGAGNIILTRLCTYETRMLIKNIEFIIDTTADWNGLFDDNGNLNTLSLEHIEFVDMTKLCRLSLEVISMATLHFIKRNKNPKTMKVELADLIKQVVRDNDYTATIVLPPNYHEEIKSWLEENYK